jgi:hypothetical protein
MWRCYRDLEQVSEALRKDLRGLRRRGRLSPLLRLAVWGALLAATWPLGAPWVAPPAILLFEAFLAPRLTRPPPPRELGPLRPWHPPDSFVVSPESLPDRPTRRP